uniref:Uncharacterized protein n=1 Tax=Cucumis melo TaxID=3656 RepID=A0A9I9E6S7_CUCME
MFCSYLPKAYWKCFSFCCHIFQSGYGSNRRKYRGPWCA